MDEVLVVGGRTTGLMMACELMRRGVPTRCIDKSSGIAPHVRANLLHSRTLEIFQGLGLDEQLTVGSVPEIGFVFYRDGNPVGESPHAPIDSPFPFGMSQSQAHTEYTLESHRNRLGGNVERSVALTSLDQDEDGVTVVLKHGDKREETARYQWVIACDGARSAVRHLVGEPFPGDSDEIPYILGDVLIDGDEDLEPNKGHAFFHRKGELFAFTRLPGNRHFLVASLAKGTNPGDEPCLEDLQAIVNERARPSMRLYDLMWLGYFHISYRLATRYRRNRIFLAGDAAHVHSLLAGQGMNTGIQDAHNLAWKLALVVNRQAHDALLDSYETERRVVANNVIDMTRTITDTMEKYTDLSQQERETFVSHLFTPEIARLDAARHLQEIDLDYSASPLTQSVDDDFEDGPAPGTRAPDAANLFVGGQSTSLFKLPADDQYRLFLFCGTSGAPPVAEIQQAADASLHHASLLKAYIVRDWMLDIAFQRHTVIVDQERNMHQNYAAERPCIYLIRPDGYVALRSKTMNCHEDYLARIKMIDG
jgi:2-polyprenyl-6-methoxyphenol hydroxylase-like FAD-dependent oxidoreductase